MPLYEFQCKYCDEIQEVLRPVRVFKPPLCDSCGGDTVKRMSLSMVKYAYAPRPHDRAKDIWEGTPLEDSDGINRVYHRSDRIQLDLSA